PDPRAGDRRPQLLRPQRAGARGPRIRPGGNAPGRPAECLRQPKGPDPMSIPTLTDLKAFLRVEGNHLDVPLSLALGAAVAEAGNFVGGSLAEQWPGELPSDVGMALLLLSQVHVDAGEVEDHEYRRAAAQHLLRPYRLTTGLAA